MKKLLLINFLLFSSITIFAQLSPANLKSKPLNTITTSYGGFNHVLLTDTVISKYADRANAAYLYQGQAPDLGYIFGTYYFFNNPNYFAVTAESGIGFDAVMDANIIDVLFWAGKKYINGNADSITMKIYSTGADSMPVSLLASGRMSMADVDTSSIASTFTDIPITNGTANIASPFLVSLSYEGNDDTLGLFTSGPGNGLNEKRIRQLTTIDFGSMWIRSGDLFTFTDVDLFFIPVATINSVGTNDFFSFDNASLMPIYPSPANDLIHMDYTLKNNSAFSYCFFDLRGKKYFEQKSEQQHAGSYSEAFDVSKLASGNYYLSVTINGKTVTQKVMVTK